MTSAKLSVLILEDEVTARESITFLLQPKYKIYFAATCAEFFPVLEKRDFDIVLLDMQLPDGNGLEVLKKIRSLQPDQEVVMVTGVHDIPSVVEAIKVGASDYLAKPVDGKRLLEALAKIEQAIQWRWEKAVLIEKVRESEKCYHGMVGQSLAMRHIGEIITKLKGTDTPILLMGESGVGKEVIARAIYKQEENSLRPFVAVNCAAIPENLLESELFGHEKGAFTGASQARIGKFVQANGGDIFLDEIACMSPTLQAKLLRVLQDKQVEPLGNPKKIKSNFRVIAATNQDIKALIEKGAFRQDLYYRLQGVEIFIPPLRARPEDIPLLLEYLLKEAMPKFGPRHFTREAVQILTQYGWPGNVRELKNTVENILILNPEEVLEAFHLPPHIRQSKPEGQRSVFVHLKANIKNFERDVIVAALKRYRGNKSRASKELGISRSILYRKMKILQMDEQEIL